jgi:hypothetical protein
MHLLPIHAKVTLLQFLATRSTLLQVMLACKDWHGGTKENSTWEYLCWLKYGAQAFEKMKAFKEMKEFSPMQLYVLDVPRNLLKNACATTLEDHATSWRICGDDVSPKLFCVGEAGERPSATESQPISPTTKCWVTSNTKVHRKQTINLEACGIPLQLFDSEEPPPIHISEWFTGQGSTFRIRVKLLGVWTGEGEKWHQVSTCIETYPKGVRYICFEDWSKDAFSTNPYVALFRPAPTTDI